MKFIRDSLTKKALFLFAILVSILVIVATVLFRKNIIQISLGLFLGVLIGIMILIFIIFLLDVVLPLNRVSKEVKNLLTGKQYNRIEPSTIDEIGMFTHFFNEITTYETKTTCD